MYSDTLDVDISFDIPVRRPAFFSRKAFDVPIRPMDAKGLIIASTQIVDFQKELLQKDKGYTLHDAIKLGRSYEARDSNVKQMKDMYKEQIMFMKSKAALSTKLEIVVIVVGIILLVAEKIVLLLVLNVYDVKRKIIGLTCVKAK